MVAANLRASGILTPLLRLVHPGPKRRHKALKILKTGPRRPVSLRVRAPLLLPPATQAAPRNLRAHRVNRLAPAPRKMGAPVNRRAPAATAGVIAKVVAVP